MALLKDQKFYELCQALQCTGQTPSDPDRKAIEKAFRKLALKTHPDKGGDPTKFRIVNEAYNKLISHIDRLERMEAESDLRNTSVIIEISKQALPKWWEKLKNQYGTPKSSDVKNTIFQGPFKQYKGRGKLTGPITVILYEDPEDKIPKIHCKCQNYMAWIQEQKMPLHLHVNKDKKISFDQWRIMSLAEYDFVDIEPCSSARHDWKNQSMPKGDSKSNPKKEQEDAQRRAREEEEARLRRAKEEARRAQEEEDERKRKEKEDEIKKRSQESTSPPIMRDDGFPKVYNMTSNAFTIGGIAQQTKIEEARKDTKSDEQERIETEIKSTKVEENQPEFQEVKSSNLSESQSIMEESTSHVETTDIETNKPETTVLEDQQKPAEEKPVRKKRDFSKIAEKLASKSKQPKKSKEIKVTARNETTTSKFEAMETVLDNSANTILDSKVSSEMDVDEIDDNNKEKSFILADDVTKVKFEDGNSDNLKSTIHHSGLQSEINSRHSSEDSKLDGIDDEAEEVLKKEESLIEEQPIIFTSDSEVVIETPKKVETISFEKSELEVAPNSKKDPEDLENSSNIFVVEKAVNLDENAEKVKMDLDEKVSENKEIDLEQQSLTNTDSGKELAFDEKILLGVENHMKPQDKQFLEGFTQTGQQQVQPNEMQLETKSVSKQDVIRDDVLYSISKSNLTLATCQLNVEVVSGQTCGSVNVGQHFMSLSNNEKGTENLSKINVENLTLNDKPASSHENEKSEYPSNSLTNDDNKPRQIYQKEIFQKTSFCSDTDEAQHSKDWKEDQTPSRWQRGSSLSSTPSKHQNNEQRRSVSRLESDHFRTSISSSPKMIQSYNLDQRDASPNLFDYASNATKVHSNFYKPSSFTVTPPPPPPSKPPPPLPDSLDLPFIRPNRSSEIKHFPAAASKISMKASSTFTVDHFIRTKPDNITERIKTTDRFQQAKVDAKSNSLTDLMPSKPTDFSMFRDQIQSAKLIHQKLCDDALSYDHKKIRSSSTCESTPVTSIYSSSRSMTPQPPDSYLKSTKFEAKADTVRPRYVRSLSTGYQLPPGLPPTGFSGR